jgi:predicted Abi (CAAX) family protease
VEQLIAPALARLRRSVVTWPDAQGWAFAGGVGALTLAAMGLLGFSTGLYSLAPARTEGLPLRLLTVLIAPAMGEEAVFRGLLIPDWSETRSPWAILAGATAIFTAWHVAEVKIFMPSAAPIFLRPDFLACAAILGLGCGVIRWRTWSLWPGVGLHWLMVTVWQTWLGGFMVGP